MEVRFIIDDRIVAALARAKQVLSRRRLATLVAGATLCTFAVVLAEPMDVPHTFSNGTAIVADEVNENFSAIYGAFNDHIIRADRTFTVDLASGCPGIQSTIQGVAEYHVLPTATVTIQLSEGRYTCGSSSIVLSDLYWPRVKLAGAQPSRTTLTFAANASGILVVRSVIGGINDLLISGESATSGSGVFVDQNALVNLDRVSVSGFYDGIHLRSNSTANITNSIASGNARTGFIAYRSSALNLGVGTLAVDNGASGASVLIGSALVAQAVEFGPSGYGVEVHTGSSGFLIDCSFSENATAAVHALYDGSVNVTEQVTGTSIEGATQYAFAADHGGAVRVSGTVAATGVAAQSNIAVGTATGDNSLVAVEP